MLIKSVLCLSLLCFTTGIGYFYASKYRKRKLFYSEFYDFNERFLRELSYSKRPIKEFISSLRFKGEFFDLLKDYANNLGRDDGLDDFFNLNSFMNSDEEKEIRDFFNQIGRGDCESQKRTFNNRLAELKTRKEKCEAEYRKYADAYVKLGVLIGLAIIVIII